MGEIDLELYNFIGDNTRFADLINFTCFSGKEVISAESLHDASEKYVHHDSGTGKSQERIRDIKKYCDTGTFFQIFAIENQLFVDYTMPFRHMEYDTEEYRRQIKSIKRKNASGLKNDEWLCDFKKTDKLHPIFTIILYLGESPWDGPRTLQDMMNFDGQEMLKKWFVDYPMHLVCINEIENFDSFKTDLKEFFTILKHRKNKNELSNLIKTKPEYQNLASDTGRLLRKMTGIDKLLKNKSMSNGKEDDNMCQAIEEIWEDGKIAGRKEHEAEYLVKIINSVMENLNFNLDSACWAIGITITEYLNAKELLARPKSFFAMSEYPE